MHWFVIYQFPRHHLPYHLTNQIVGCPASIGFSGYRWSRFFLGFDLSTEPCLPRAKRTSYRSLSVLALIIVVSGFSCIFDAYACRWRAQICNFYYPLRAKERGEYLYKRIKAGRGNRRFQMTIAVKRELKRRAQLKEFSWWTKFVASSR